MTDIAFHFNVSDRIRHACRLLRKAISNGAQVVVTGEPETLGQLDAALWTFSAVDFVPHSYLQGEPTMVAASPILLTPATGSVPHHDVLLNLGDDVAAGFDKFERVIEVVGLDDQQRVLARKRWKHYIDAGYSITRHDLTLKT